MLVIYNAHLYTHELYQPVATAIAIDHGRILAVGNDDQILASFSTANIINADGRTVMPGLIDAHIHLEDFALGLRKIDCETDSLDECLQRVALRVITTPPGEWVLGHGWNQNNWDEGYGTASMLDEIAPNNPVYLTHKSLHCAWANSTALHLAGITPDTSDPVGGRISRLPDRQPDGILFESAMGVLEQALPEPNLEQVTEALRAAIPLLWKMGLTSVHDFDGMRCYSALQVLHQRHELNFRVHKAIHLEDLPGTVAAGLHSGSGDDFLQLGPLKMFSDGALGPHTAAMLAPYEDEPGSGGMLMLDAAAVFEHGRIAVENGIHLAIHAIGDRANREVLNGLAKLRDLEASRNAYGQSRLRHRIEHVQVVHPDELSRFNGLEVIASMQPIHATSDMHMADLCWGKRSAYAYAWRSLAANQAKLIFGSDAPVETPNPFLGLYAAVTRRRADGTPSPEGWYPDQRLSITEALQAYTTGPAYAAGMEDRLGKLLPGYLADLIIINDNPYTCSPEEFLLMHPSAVMVSGEWVFSELD
ncbi:MAG: amidohydrolase [Anaerolineales bacterium]|nr:amidohydrolase [Anaerolineae bacterium]PWB54942.1 MAG: amidohydrolase [Anaerolineales bacterium]